VTASGWADHEANARYLLHAANVLPELVAACKALSTNDAAVRRFQAAVARADDVEYVEWLTQVQSDGPEVRFVADAFAHFVIETENGLGKVVVGVSGHDAEALV